jgi:peptide-methionine (S)-S-oxide reductase
MKKYKLITFLFTHLILSSAWAAQETAIFAGGCFWCMEPPFDKLDGVISTTSGYTGGHTKNPTYSKVSAGSTGHAEALKVIYDPAKISYSKLLKVFWRNIDPTTEDAQFCDHGNQYRAGIFYLNDQQKLLAEDSKQSLINSKRFDNPIVTEITAASKFYDAENYHQNYYQKNPLKYKFYRYHCGRDKFLNKYWDKKLER